MTDDVKMLVDLALSLRGLAVRAQDVRVTERALHVWVSVEDAERLAALHDLALGMNTGNPVTLATTTANARKALAS